MPEKKREQQGFVWQIPQQLEQRVAQIFVIIAQKTKKCAFKRIFL
jgi:hypothetical protein